MNTTPDRPDDTTPGTPPSDDLLAAEYVLGVLDTTERRAVQTRLSTDTGFAQLVDDWEERLSAWTLRADAATPSPHVWPRIRSQLGWASVESARPRLWDNAAFWRGVAGLAAAAGIAAVVIGLDRAPVTLPVAQETAAQPVTVLARTSGATGWIARIDAAHGKVLMVPVPAPAAVARLRVERQGAHDRRSAGAAQRDSRGRHARRLARRTGRHSARGAECTHRRAWRHPGDLS